MGLSDKSMQIESTVDSLLQALHTAFTNYSETLVISVN